MVIRATLMIGVEEMERATDVVARYQPRREAAITVAYLRGFDGWAIPIEAFNALGEAFPGQVFKI